mgnify:CR=1 FL=1
MRYYIDNSSIFDSAPYYQAREIAEILKASGIKKVRLARKYGWSNQPQVVTFEGDSSLAESALVSSGVHPLIKKWGVIIREKDWG